MTSAGGASEAVNPVGGVNPPSVAAVEAATDGGREPAVIREASDTPQRRSRSATTGEAAIVPPPRRSPAR